MGTDQLVSGGDVNNPVYDSVETDGVDYNNFTPDYRLNGGEWAFQESTHQTTTSTSFTTLYTGYGAIDLGAIPANATLHARFIARMTNDTAGETTFAQPRVFNVTQNGFSTLDALQISATGTDNETADSGWVDISGLQGDVIQLTTLLGKVSAGTGQVFSGSVSLSFAGVESVA